MNPSRPFSAESNKLAYAQAFTRTAAPHQNVRPERQAPLRGLASRLHRPVKPTR